jgi:polyvinyl alcohol dehydrogenase (cytochrome)
MAALDLDTGAVVWQVMMAPPGFPGNAVWGSSPAVDTKRGQLYIATGNNYDAPPETLACVAAAGGEPSAQQACLPAADSCDAVILDGRLDPVHRRGHQLPQTRRTRLRLRTGAGAVHGPRWQHQP